MRFELEVIFDEPGIGRVIRAGNWEYTEVYHTNGNLEIVGWEWRPLDFTSNFPAFNRIAKIQAEREFLALTDEQSA